MKLAIDIKSAQGDKTGKGVYCHEIVTSLLKQTSEEVILYGSEYDTKVTDEFKKYPHAKVILFSRGIFWHLKVAYDVLKKYKRGEVDAYFSPSSYIVAYLLIVLKKCGIYVPKIYITVHDLVAFISPDSHEKKATVIERFTLKRVVDGADAIFCVSEATMQDVIAVFHVEASKCLITYNAVRAEKFNTVHGADAKKIQKKYNLPENYILSLGTLIPRKNISVTLQAFAKLPDSYHLVIVGGKGWDVNTHQLVLEAQKNPRVHLLGYVPHDELPALYRCASVFVYPSLYEGFGIPILEAQSMGCPVITSNLSSMPEVGGKGVLLIDPTISEELATAITHVVTDVELRKELVENGSKNISRFSWDTSSEKILERIRG